MIETAWPFVAVLLLAAALFPLLEAHTRARLFEVLPPIVLLYLLVTALAVAGAWSATDDAWAPNPDCTSRTRVLPFSVVR